MAKSPVTATLDTVKGALPKSDIATVWLALVVPNGCGAKATTPGVSAAAAALVGAISKTKPLVPQPTQLAE
jgi:hypothetical protein